MGTRAVYGSNIPLESIGYSSSLCLLPYDSSSKYFKFYTKVDIFLEYY